MYKNVPVLDSGARGSTTTFVERGIGDVFISWENEAFLAVNELGKDKFEIVVPSVSILAEPPVSLVDKVVDRRGTRSIAQAYLEYLYTPEGQEIAAKHYYRPRLAAVAKKYAGNFPAVKLFTIDEVFGGWAKLRRRISNDGAPSTKSINPNSTQGTQPMRRAFRPHSILPGFGLTMGFTIFYLSLIILIPLGAAFLKTLTMGWPQFWETVTGPRALASYRLSIGASLVAASINSVLGLLAAWVLVRYEFPGKRIVDALIDLPFALPTAVAGITLTAMFAGEWLGGQLARTVGHQSRFHLAWRRRCADFYRLTIRCPHGATGAAGAGSGNRRSRGHPGRKPLAILAASHTSRAITRTIDRLRARVCAGGGRIRLGGLYFGKHADENRDHAAADHHQARTV